MALTGDQHKSAPLRTIMAVRGDEPGPAGLSSVIAFLFYVSFNSQSDVYYYLNIHARKNLPIPVSAHLRSARSLTQRHLNATT